MSNSSYSSYDHSFSEKQQIALEIVPKFPALMSMIGSSAISYIVLSDRRRKLRTGYHRILLTVSFVDIVASMGFFLGSWLAPKDTPGLWQPKGSFATCNFGGFLINFVVVELSILGYLSLYYLFTVRYRVSESVLKKYLEPCMHLTVFLIVVVIGLASVFNSAYNPMNNGWCYHVDYPRGCSTKFRDDDCIRGQNYEMFVNILAAFAGISLFLTIFSMVVIFLHIRKTEKAGSQHFMRRTPRRRSKTRETLIQAILFVCSFLISIIWSNINQWVREFKPANAENRSFYFPLTLLATIFQVSSSAQCHLVFHFNLF